MSIYIVTENLSGNYHSVISEHPVTLPHTCVHCWVRGIGGNYYDDGGDDGDDDYDHDGDDDDDGGNDDQVANDSYGS